MTSETSRKWAILAVITLVSFITNVDATIVVIGLPRLMEDLHLTIVSGFWTITAYLITSTVFLLPAGKWADMFGAKRIFNSGLALFTIATCLCGLAQSGTALIIFRLIQGTGAAMALATATPIMMRTFPRSQLGLAIGINSTSWVIGSIVGPVAGGTLLSTFGWPSIFYVCIPFSLVGIIGGLLLLKEPTVNRQSRTDWFGFLTFGTGITALLVALSEGQDWGWSSAPILELFALTLLMLAAFIFVELRVRLPLFNLKLFTYRHFTTGLVITMCYCIGYFAITTLLTLYLQDAQHLSPLDTGLLLIPLSAPQLVLAPFGGRLADRFGPHRLILCGVLVIALSLVLLGNLGEQLSVAAIIVPLLLISIANGLAWPSLAKTVLASAPQEHAGSASGMFYTLYNIGRAVSQTLALLIVEQNISPSFASRLFMGEGTGEKADIGTNAKTAIVSMTDTGFRIFAVCFVLCFLFGLLLRRPQKDKLELAAGRQS
ncbi:MFS transporter [Paenibacillus glycanilyticus]|uniref:MFS transporter n=1 Tax=Paenibacillus glycanilyticus TaxID=126569 RepID=UPI00191017F6|nr:MFS transporter [Paenibacillus glycanilyticus]